jgi:hypothetical protein
VTRIEQLDVVEERLGDVSGGDEGAEAFRVALRLCRELRRPVDQELRVLGSLDLDRSLAPEAIWRIVTAAAADGLKLLEAQARRALGISLRDPAELGRALEIFEETRAAVRRAGSLRAGAPHPRPGRARGRPARLEALGDLDQLARVERARGQGP